MRCAYDRKTMARRAWPEEIQGRRSGMVHQNPPTLIADCRRLVTCAARDWIDPIPQIRTAGRIRPRLNTLV
jgi:hypothetical protein